VTEPARPAWPTPWPEVDRAVERLRDGVVEAIGGDLVGLYLSGSLGLGDFDPASSDVDVLVATAGPLPGPAVGRLRRLHGALRAEGGWAARLEVVYLPLAALRRFDPEDAGRYPIGASDRDFTLGRQGPTWVLDRWVAREHGLVVVGPDPRELIDPIGPEQLRAAVRASLAGHWALEGADVAWLRPRLPGVRGPEHVPGPVRAGARHGGVQAGGGRLGEPASGAAVDGPDRAGPRLAVRRAHRRPGPAGDAGVRRPNDRAGPLRWLSGPPHAGTEDPVAESPGGGV
jgi:hypothetical protein